jgi:hypothetical protein
MSYPTDRIANNLSVYLVIVQENFVADCSIAVTFVAYLYNTFVILNIVRLNKTSNW